MKKLNTKVFMFLNKFIPRRKTLRKLFSCTLTVALVTTMTGITSFIPITKAAVTGATVTQTVQQDQKIKASSSTTTVAKIAISNDSQAATLTSVTASFSGTGFATSDLANLATDNTSGVALYTGTSSAPTSAITLAEGPAWDSTSITLTPATPPDLTASGPTYFYVVIKTSGTLGSGDEIIATIATDGIVVSGGESTLSAEFTSNTLTADTTVPTVHEAFAQGGNASKVQIFFSEFVQRSTVECSTQETCANIYTVSGGLNTTSATSGGDWTYTDAVELTLDADATNGTTTVIPATTILDPAGNALTDYSGSPITLEENFPPVIKGVKLVNGTTVGVIFDRAMDSTTTDVIARYTLTTAADDTETVTSAALQGDNVTVNVAATGATIANGDNLQINGIQNFQDTSGVPAQGNEYFMIDGTKPKVIGVIKEDNPSGNDYVYLRFDDWLDHDTAETAGNYTPNAGSITAATAFIPYHEQPSWMTPDMEGKVVKLTTPDVTAINVSITVSTDITDRAGNAVDSAGGINVVSLAGSAANAIAISDTGVSMEMFKGNWGSYSDGCNDSSNDTGNTCNDDTNDNLRDIIRIPFTGAIDTAYLGEDSNGLIKNISGFLEIYEKQERSAGSADECSSEETFDTNKCINERLGSLDQSYAKVTDNEATNYTENTNGIANDVLTIYLQGYVDVMGGMEINPSNIKGLNGLAATQHATPTKNRIPMPQFADVEYVKTDITKGVNNAAIDAADTVTMFFSADMNRGNIGSIGDANTKLKPTQMSPRTEHSWGTNGTIAWGNIDGSNCDTGAGAGTGSDGTPDCLKITLGATGLTVAEGDEIMSNGLSSTAGMPLGFGGKVDATAPTATATLNTTTDIVTIVFSEEMVENDGTEGDYSDNISYNGSGGSTDAAIDGAYNSNGFTAGIKLISDSSAGGTSGDGWNPIKKFALKLDVDPEAGDEITFTNLVDEGGSAVVGTINPSADAVAPTICKVIQNDWDGNGSLNAHDEIILAFDNEDPADSSNGCNSDIDYSTITNPNTDFVVKRSAAPVSNPFGQGVNFWVDQMDQHVGELHINLGQGADIRAGDEIWGVTDEVADLNGNKMAALTQITLSSSEGGEITKIVFDNADGSVDQGNPTLTNGDTFVVHFNTAIDPNTLGTYSGAAVTNLDWGLPIRHNDQANYGGGYTYMKKTWGSATGSWNAGFDQLTITLAGGNSVFGDFDLVEAEESVRTADGGRIRKPGTIDTSSPTLKNVAGDPTVAGAAETFEAGDKLIFIFSDPMTDTTVVVGELGISNGSLGDGAAIQSMDPEKRVYEVTLGANLNIVADTTAFNPSVNVKDINGNADGTLANVTVNTNLLPPPQNISASDADTTYGGIDGRDLTVTWTKEADDSVTTQYNIYVLPEFVPFNQDSHKPVAIATASSACTGASCTFTGASSLNADTRSMKLENGSPILDDTKPFFPFSELDQYVVFITGTNDGATKSSFPTRTNTTFQFSMEYAADGRAPEVKEAMPWNGAKDIPPNAARVSIRFNEMMARSTIESGSNIILEKKNGDSWASVTAYISYDEGDFMAHIEPDSALDVNTEHRVRVTTSVTDAGGTALASEFATYFTTGATNDSTAPKVETYYFDGSTITADIPLNTSTISVKFTEGMKPSTFTSNSVTLSPSVSGSDIGYDPGMQSLNYTLGGPLERNTSYTLTLSGVYITDNADNKLDGDGNGTAAGTTADNYTLSFTTIDEALSSTKPKINWMDSNSNSILVGFDNKMNKDTVEKKANWTLTQGGNIVDLQTATFLYWGFDNELHIEGVSLTAGSSYTLTPTSSVLGMNGQDIDTGNSILTFTPWSENTVFNSTNIANTSVSGMDGTFNGDMFAKMGDDNVAEDHDIKTFMPIQVMPMERTADKTTNYHVNFPTTKAIINGGKILLEFPSSFDVSGASIAKDPNNELFLFNQDINGPGGTMTSGSTFDQDGKVQIASISANNQTKVITLTLAVDDGTGCTLDSSADDETPVIDGNQNAADNSIYGEFMATCTDTNQDSTTMPYDFIDFELAGIKNGSAAAIDFDNNTGGYQVEITTKNATGKTLEGPIKSGKFDIKEAGNGSISGTVTATDGTTAIASALVFLDSSMAGHMETTTDSNGNYSFTQLPIAPTDNPWDGWYRLWIESPENSNNYFGGQGFEIQLTSSSPTSSGNDVELSSATNTITFTITHTGDDLDGEDVEIWAGGPSGHNNKKVTLEADGSTDATLKIGNGMWDFGVHPYMKHSAFGGAGHIEQKFMPPASEQKNISGDDTVSFALTNSDYTISGVVTDGTSGLANVGVNAYSPLTGDVGTSTAADGSYTLNVPSGIYEVGIFKPGLPPRPPRTVTVGSASVPDIDFVLFKPGSTISGTVTDGTNAIQYAGVNAWTSDGKQVNSQTDEQGGYTLYVDSGTWNVEVLAPEYGRLEPASGVTATNIAVASSTNVTDIDFSVAQGTYYLISGQVKDASNNGIANIFVKAEEVNYVGGNIGTNTGNSNDAQTDSSGNFSITVKANTAGTGASATRYVLNAWNDDYGNIQPDSTTPVDVSAANSTGNDFTVATQREMTISIINGDQLEIGSIDIEEASVGIFSPSEDIGNHRRFKNINLTNGDNASIGTINVSQGSGYEAHLHIPGVGGFDGTLSSNSNFAINANGTIVFDLSLDGANSVITISGTVNDGTNAIEGALVSVSNLNTKQSISDTTASDGTYSIKVPSGTTYILNVDHPDYKSPPEIVINGADTGRTISLAALGSTITGTVYASDGTTAVPYAFVTAEEVGADGWSGVEADKDGAYTLRVPASTKWTISAKDDQGNTGEISGSVSAGATSQNITLSSALAGASYITDQPGIYSVTPSKGGMVDDTDNTGVVLNASGNAFGTGSNPGQVLIEETAAIPKTNESNALGGIAKEINVKDSDGSSILSFDKDITVELVYKKSEIDSFTGVNNDAPKNGLEELNKIQPARFDKTKKEWVPLNTNKTVEVKNAAADTSWTKVDFDTFVTNVTGNGSNSSGDQGSEKDYYADYKITLSSNVDSPGIFAAVTPSEDRVVPPDTGVLSADETDATDATIKSNLNNSRIPIHIKDAKSDVVTNITALASVASNIDSLSSLGDSTNINVTKKKISFTKAASSSSGDANFDTAAANTSSIVEPVVLLPEDTTSADAQKTVVSIPEKTLIKKSDGSNLADGVNIEPVELGDEDDVESDVQSAAGSSDFDVKDYIKIPTNQGTSGGVTFEDSSGEDQYVDICVPGTSATMNVFTANDIQIYSKNEDDNNWTVDSNVKNKKFSGEQFCYQTNHFTDFVIGASPSSPSPSPSSSPSSSSGGGGSSAPPAPPSDSNTDTSSIASTLGSATNKAKSISRPVSISDNLITQTASKKSAQLTKSTGTITLKPNKDATISVKISGDTKVSASTKWDGKIDPPIIKSRTVISKKGEKVTGSTHKLERNKIQTIVKVGSTKSKLTFDKKVTLEVPIDAPDGTKLYVYHSEDGNAWTKFDKGKVVTVKDGKVAIETDHFSYFAFELAEGEVSEEAAETKEVDEQPEPELINEVVSGREAMPFMDLSGHWAREFVEVLYQRGVIDGYADGIHFGPNDQLTRSQAIKIALNMFGYDAPDVTSKPFDDVDPNQWYAKYVAKGKELGIVQGYTEIQDGVTLTLFKPNQPVTRSEALKILFEAAQVEVDSVSQSNPFTDVKISDWSRKYVLYAYQNQIVDGYSDKTFRPHRNITRGEISKIALKIAELE